MNIKSQNKRGVVVIIGGGRLQKPYFNLARKYNLKIALTDKNPECVSRHLADYFIEADGQDTEKIKSFVIEIAKKEDILGVYCGSDFGLRTVAIVAKEVGLKYTSLECVENSLDKNKAKKLIRDVGILVPDGEIFEVVEDALEYFKNRGEAIIKPVESSGSRGICYIGDLKEFRGAFEQALKFSDNVLVEEFIEGRHIDANAFLIDGKFFPLGTGEREFFNHPHPVTLKAMVPAKIDEEIEGIAYDALKRSANALGIRNGPIKGDFILRDENLYLIEAGPRFHGDIYSTHLSSIIFEKPLIELFFRYITYGIEPKAVPTNKKGGFYGIFANPGQIKRVTGIERALSLSNIKEVIILKEGNFTIKHNRDNNSLIGYILGESFEYDGLDALLTKARNSIGFEYL